MLEASTYKTASNYQHAQRTLAGEALDAERLGVDAELLVAHVALGGHVVSGQSELVASERVYRLLRGQILFGAQLKQTEYSRLCECTVARGLPCNWRRRLPLPRRSSCYRC